MIMMRYGPTWTLTSIQLETLPTLLHVPVMVGQLGKVHSNEKDSFNGNATSEIECFALKLK